MLHNIQFRLTDNVTYPTLERLKHQAMAEWIKTASESGDVKFRRIPENPGSELYDAQFFVIPADEETWRALRNLRDALKEDPKNMVLHRLNMLFFGQAKPTYMTQEEYDAKLELRKTQFESNGKDLSRILP